MPQFLTTNVYSPWGVNINVECTVTSREARLFRIHSEMNGKVITFNEKDSKLKMFENEDKKTQQWYEDKHGVLYSASNKWCIDSRSKSIRFVCEFRSDLV